MFIPLWHFDALGMSFYCYARLKFESIVPVLYHLLFFYYYARLKMILWSCPSGFTFSTMHRSTMWYSSIHSYALLWSDLLCIPFSWPLIHDQHNLWGIGVDLRTASFLISTNCNISSVPLPQAEEFYSLHMLCPRQATMSTQPNMHTFSWPLVTFSNRQSSLYWVLNVIVFMVPTRA